MATITDLDFAPPMISPFPAGTSPFRQKGNGYLGDMRHLAAVLPGGFDAAVAAIMDAPTRAFFRQSFRPSEWYDAYPGAVLEAAAARLRGLSFEAHRRQTGAWHANESAKGIYGALLRMVSNENIALWGPRISSVYFEFGKTDTRVVGLKEVALTRRGIPRELAQWLMFASAGFATGSLRIAGARNPHVTLHEVEPDGHAHGRELVRIHARLRWD